MLLYKINGGGVMEVKFKIINNIKEEDSIEARMHILKNNISHSRFIWLIYTIVAICLFLYRFIYFKRFYSHSIYSVYSVSYKEILIGLFIIFTGIYVWKLPSIMEKKGKKVDKEYVNTEEKIYFHETCIKEESISGNKDFEYSNIKKVYETDTKLIFLFKKNRYMFITKDAFVIGDSNSFREFLKSKIDNKATKYIIK